MRVSKKYLAPALIATVALTLAGCAPAVDSGSGGDDLAPVDVSVITSQTGPLAAYGEAYLAGFDAGLDYATDGTGTVDGRELNITITDDAGDADKAVTAAKDVIGQGQKIIVGTVSSGIALALAEQAEQNKVLYISGPAAADGITGVNDYTFRSGRQSFQDVATAGTFIGDPAGKSVLVFAQDTAFGQGNVAAATAVLGGQGADVTSLLVPEDATEFTPFAQQIVDAQPDLVFVAWAGATSGAMWEALSQQGVFDSVPVATGLGDVSTYGAYGAASDQISFLNHYFGGATDNDANAAMVSYLEAEGKQADLFSPDGFVAAQMVVQAVREGGDDVDAMIAALEGWTFDSVKGSITVRAEDHAMIQPMFQVSLVADGDSWIPELVTAVDADAVTPPVAE
ncbi:amino acid/amide ABC transporter substrate-binding protein (HAAT family) [Salinibacterium amurskyense]|uniref:Amino acid/amide ABC transporter substrate-binding protein (HAAT family) n=1 Tax=Salinibacterium amurskyense TaxID=205941 RepID=A0A2M9D212_9MICO|nr:substrate-binding domain-containing protein [Salinibacterium amurskyense]PJJ78093.1 amino acid/amide ABC transporter substrate-binding protein (HAAT family) [Salinibacterium amurskyense]RLQ80245.1 amino acid ABC transporter substrate-binding protein [Salinibacterium amurskyense]GHD82519.1 ABC transporter substrate-binding protein [Salinibacterium amurskyense]